MSQVGMEMVLKVKSRLERLTSDRDALLVVAKRIYAELDNLYDVDQEGEHYRESPFSGAGELMNSLRKVIEQAERA